MRSEACPSTAGAARPARDSALRRAKLIGPSGEVCAATAHRRSERRSVIANYCSPMPCRPHRHGGRRLRQGDRLLDLAICIKLSSRTAAVYIRRRISLGVIESQGARIAALAHRHGAEFIVGVDRLRRHSGAARGSFGADIVVGHAAPRRPHDCGAARAASSPARRGTYATNIHAFCLDRRDDRGPASGAFGLSLLHQSSTARRENGKDWTGNSSISGRSSRLQCRSWGPRACRTRAADHPAGPLRAATLAKSAGHRVVFPRGFFKNSSSVSRVGKTVAEIKPGATPARHIRRHDLRPPSRARQARSMPSRRAHKGRYPTGWQRRSRRSCSDDESAALPFGCLDGRWSWKWAATAAGE